MLKNFSFIIKIIEGDSNQSRTTVNPSFFKRHRFVLSNRIPFLDVRTLYVVIQTFTVTFIISSQININI
jgi:hypothetical protein